MVMRRYENLFKKTKLIEPPADLFDKIIAAIKREKELQRTKKILISSFSLLIASFVAMPFSFNFFIEQLRNSGVIYFISIVLSDFKVFLSFWQDFTLAILESLPIFPLLVFMGNLFFLTFTLWLLYLRKEVVSYLIRK